MLFLLLAVQVLRFYRLSELPPGIQSDEGPDGVYALQVLDGVHSVFFPEKGSGREAIGVYAIAIAHLLLGKPLYLRFTSPLPWPAPAQSSSYSGWDSYFSGEMKKLASPFIGGVCWLAPLGLV